MATIFLNVLSQVVFFILIIYLVGFIISLINRAFYGLALHKTAVCYATGFIGTPVHELSHAAMCLLFFHHIEEIKLFQINDEDGVLGYVNHTYNPKNVYQQIGNYFIGVAPIVVGSLILLLGIRFLLPNTMATFGAEVQAIANTQRGGFSFALIGKEFTAFGTLFRAIFSDIGVGILWWVFMVLALCICIHMNLSMADLKGSLVALPLLIILIIAANLILGLIFNNGAYAAFVDFMNMAGTYVTCVLLLSLVFSVFALAVMLLVRGVLKIFHIG